MLFAQAFKFAVLLASSAFLARLLSPELFGLMAMLITVTSLADVFRDLGLGMAALRAPSLTDGQRSNLFWVNLALGGLVAVLVYLFAPVVAAFYQNPSLAEPLRALSAVFIVSGASVQYMTSINRDLRFGTLAAIEVIAALIASCVAISLAILDFGLWALVAQPMASAIVVLVLSISVARWLPRMPRRREGTRALLGFGFNLLGSQLVTYGFRNADSIMLGRVLGAAPLGFYDRAYQLLVAPLNQVNAPLSKVAVPMLARVQSDAPRFARAALKAQYAAIYLTLPIMLLLAGLAEPLVRTLYGEAWAPSAAILAVLALGGVPRALSQVAYWIFMARGMAGQFLRMQLWTQPAIVVFMAIGLLGGPLGVAAGHSVGFLLYWLVTIVWVERKLGVRLRDNLGEVAIAVFLVAGPAALAGWVTSRLVDPPLLSLLLGAGVSIVCLLLEAALVRPVRHRVAGAWALFKSRER